jgi:hypothetical protein
MRRTMFGEFRKHVAATAMFVVTIGGGLSASAPADPKPSELFGTWRGTSTCTDRVAAPACNDEVVIYEFTAGSKPGSVLWKADKVINGQREPMGEFELVYDAAERCWSAEFRARFVWCLVVDGAHLTGTGRMLPGKQITRRVDVRRAPPARERLRS